MKRPKQVQSSKIVHQNPYYKIMRDRFIKNDQTSGLYYYIEAEPFVINIALTADRESLYMVKTWRYPVSRYNWEFPMGWREKNETILMAAKRELVEEVGLKAKKWQRLGWFHLGPGISAQKGFVYLAEDIVPMKQAKIDDEVVTSKLISVKQLKTMIAKNQIVDAPTLVAAQMLLTHLS